MEQKERIQSILLVYFKQQGQNRHDQWSCGVKGQVHNISTAGPFQFTWSKEKK